MARTDYYDLLVNPKAGPPKVAGTGPEAREVDSQAAISVERPNQTGLPFSSNVVKLLLILPVTALVLSGALTLYFRDLSRQQSLHGQSLNALQQALQENGQQTASLQSQLEVIMDRLGVTQKDLETAQARAVKLREAQAQKVKDMVLPQLETYRLKIEALGEDITRKADQEKLSTLEREAERRFRNTEEKISALSQDVTTSRQQLTQILAQLADLAEQVARRGDSLQKTSLP